MVVDIHNQESQVCNYEDMKVWDCRQSSLSSPEDLYRDIHTNMSQQFKEPPPYPGPPKQSNSQTGLHQSFSGSETSTDVSVSSTENLPSCHRQEPQGEETQGPATCMSSYDSSDYSILERLGMPMQGNEQKFTTTPQIYITGNYQDDIIHGHYITTSMANPGFGSHDNQMLCMSNDSGFTSCYPSSSKLTMDDSGSSSSVATTSGYHIDHSASVLNRQQLQSNFSSPNSSASSYSTGTIYKNYPLTSHSSSYEQGSYSHHSPYFMRAHPTPVTLPHMLPAHNFTTLPPPPEYPGFHNAEHLDSAARRSYEILAKPEIGGSRSQPDMTNFVDMSRQPTKHMGIIHTPAGSGSDKGSIGHSVENLYHSDPTRYSDIDQIAQQASRMVELLTEENCALRNKVSAFDKKVTRLQKFELEIQKLQENYESLVKSSKKREQLEVTMKKRLEEELKKAKAVNSSLVQRLQNAGITVSENQILASAEPVDSSMPLLLARHKEILSIKEHQERELEAQKSTIQEQKAQIEILRNVQANQMRMMEEDRRREIIAEYDEEIKCELADIKAAYEKKTQTEKNIRLKLEKELEYCRQHHNQTKTNEGKKEANSDLRKLLEGKEVKILQLEKELIQWKEQHLEESIRKLRLQESEVDTLPRLPAYDQATSTLNAEHLINEAKTEKLKQMEEVYQANRKLAELEASVKSLQSQLKEKDAMLRVYQRSPMTRSSSVHSIYCTPHHSPRPSLVGTGSLSRQTSQEVKELLAVKHKKTGSTSALEAYSKTSQEDLLRKIEDLKKEPKSSSDTEETDAIWQV